MSTVRFVSDVAAAAVGLWPDLLAGLGLHIPRHGKHGPCPACGGKDRFRLDDKEGRGTFICSQCGAGDGLDLVCRVMSKSPMEAAELIAPMVGLAAGGLDPVERGRIHQQQQAKVKEETRKREDGHRKAAARACRIMNAHSRGCGSAYLSRKGFAEHQSAISGTKETINGEVFPAGSVIVPLLDGAGNLVNVELIRNEDGLKHTLGGGRKAGVYHRIDGGGLVAVVEGYATGLSVQQATGATVYCAMSANNLMNVAEIARSQNPDAEIIICGDHDLDNATGQRNDSTKHQTEQAALAVGGRALFPPEAGDWNDYHQAHGLSKTQEAIMSASTRLAVSQSQNASQKGEASRKIEEREHEPPATMIDKMSASQRAALLVERLGQVAISLEAERVYRYDGGLWTPWTDTELRREMAAIFTEHGVPFSDKSIATTVSTMKLMIPTMGQPTKELIGFANGVYDMATRQFRPHSPSNGLLTHNGINYAPPLVDECLERDAPNFTRWLSHAVDNNAAKMARINAALYMVLANRYDWQLFLEVTGEGGSGKSIFANVAILLAGGKRNTGSGNMASLDHAKSRYQFVDKRLIVLPDQPKYIGDGSGIKAITGGDLVEIDGKYEKQFATVIQAVVLATNNEPMVITERNGGISRRRVIFTFDRVVAEADKDPLLGDKIAAELPVVIRYLLAQFTEPEHARHLLLEQRNSDDALIIKRATDPVIDLCGMVLFLDEPKGLMMGGNPEIKREPRRYLYHAYLAFMEYHGLGRPLSVQGFSRALKAAAKEYGRQYCSRVIKGKSQTNIMLTEVAEMFLPQAVYADQ
ncbi:primase-helicase zinc-binding domain-containing protein [Aeromonas caviae]|uniref:primase-helicase zinc-binding domain-containing protein n=1 Tax=Aeromonas caviae TaxID=648 RepID=UPI00191ECD78|nr:primase-helicase zinc-binding domain-containing protein [Aeromonas caviae]MBL0558246.1 toprim domain-containing protein [Aeromonas caviae]MCR3929980.1 toprim domain-containing protein [Aeromonas caviae]MDH1847121.1 toprim domain-containing protein [Aeromonas caviae]MDX7613260.1 primase-helicase zinc-binding domain-containing protein [Aeromonas caviae]MDX7690121.1 primase-helicase zinc-binding domain-containing protein [Aeromonas caviae]